jgi:hypothetical protein
VIFMGLRGVEGAHHSPSRRRGARPDPGSAIRARRVYRPRWG